MCFLIFLYILQFIHYERLISCRVVVQGPGPGPRYGHVMALVGQRYLMAIGGNDGNSLRIQASSFFFFGGGGGCGDKPNSYSVHWLHKKTRDAYVEC